MNVHKWDERWIKIVDFKLTIKDLCRFDFMVSQTLSLLQTSFYRSTLMQRLCRNLKLITNT